MIQIMHCEDFRVSAANIYNSLMTNIHNTSYLENFREKIKNSRFYCCIPASSPAALDH